MYSSSSLKEPNKQAECLHSSTIPWALGGYQMPLSGARVLLVIQKQEVGHQSPMRLGVNLERTDRMIYKHTGSSMPSSSLFPSSLLQSFPFSSLLFPPQNVSLVESPHFSEATSSHSYSHTLTLTQTTPSQSQLKRKQSRPVSACVHLDQSI